MTTKAEEKNEIRCVFCDRKLSREEVVRYRGAISCRECASSQEQTPHMAARPFFLLASIGCIIGLMTVEFNLIYDLMYRQVLLSSYIPPLPLYFTGLSIAVILQSLGFYAMNKPINKNVGILVVIVGLLVALLQIFSVMDIFVNGPFVMIEEVLIPKDFTNYFSTTHLVYSIFVLAAGLSILVEIGHTRIENTAIAAGALYLVSGVTVASAYIWPAVGFLHIVMYAVAFVYFITRRETPEEKPITTLGYE